MYVGLRKLDHTADHGPPELVQFTTYEIPQVFSISALCIMGCRLILNLRHAFYHPGADGALLALERASLELREVDVGQMLGNIELGDIEEVSRMETALE